VSRLVKQIKGKGEAPLPYRELSAIPITLRPSSPAGVVIDGVTNSLEGEPPRAVSHGWGDMSWWYRRWR
jgi:hypothetical protein